jgi:hypothetical protein
MVQDGRGTNINNLGSAIFLTEKSMEALWIKLYLLDQGKNFKLVHKEQDFVVENLKQQGADIGDFVFYQGIRGPIKIWQISYPPDTKFKPEYLDTEYLKSVRTAKPIF